MKNKLPAKIPTASANRSAIDLCSSACSSCLTIESMCDRPCVDFSLIFPHPRDLPPPNLASLILKRHDLTLLCPAVCDRRTSRVSGLRRGLLFCRSSDFRTHGTLAVSTSAPPRSITLREERHP